VLIVKSDFDGDWSGFKGGIFNVVGTISVIGDLRGDGFVGAVDFNHKRISSVLSWVSIVINGVNGETGWLVVPQFFDTISFSITLRWINRPFDMRMEGSIFDGLVVESHVDSVVSRALDLVFNRVSTITVVLEGWVDLFGTSDVNDEGISTGVNRVAISVDGVNGEFTRFLGFSFSQSWSFSV